MILATLSAVTLAHLVQGADFVPTAGFIIGVTLASLPLLGVMVWGAVKILAPVTQALAHRISGRGDDSRAFQTELDDLRLRVDTIQGELAEAQERLEFTERLLSRGRAAIPEGER